MYGIFCEPQANSSRSSGWSGAPRPYSQSRPGTRSKSKSPRSSWSEVTPHWPRIGSTCRSTSSRPTVTRAPQDRPRSDGSNCRIEGPACRDGHVLNRSEPLDESEELLQRTARMVQEEYVQGIDHHDDRPVNRQTGALPHDVVRQTAPDQLRNRVGTAETVTLDEQQCPRRVLLQRVRQIQKHAGLADSGLSQHRHRPRPALDRVEDRSRFRPLDTDAGYVTNP